MNIWGGRTTVLNAGLKFLSHLIQGKQVGATWRIGQKPMDKVQKTLFEGFTGNDSTTPQIGEISYYQTKKIGPIQIKDGVVFKVLRPEIYTIFSLLSNLFAQHGRECVITSANDSKHAVESKHYKDLAIDIRSKHLLDSLQKHGMASELKRQLGNDYQVLFEYEGEPNEHFHIGYLGPL